MHNHKRGSDWRGQDGSKGNLTTKPYFLPDTLYCFLFQLMLVNFSLLLQSKNLAFISRVLDSDIAKISTSCKPSVLVNEGYYNISTNEVD